jgi:hypothetical protein
MTTRVTFTLPPDDLDAVQRIALDYRLPVAQVLRDAVRMHLADETPYCAALLQRLGYGLPSSEQVHASEQLIHKAMQTDMSGLIRACTPPPHTEIGLCGAVLAGGGSDRRFGLTLT